MDNQEKIREILEDLKWNVLNHIGDERNIDFIGLALSQILKLTNLKPLDEKEVKELLSGIDLEVVIYHKIHKEKVIAKRKSRLVNVDVLAHAICQHFSLPDKPLKALTKEKFKNILCEFPPSIAEDSGRPEWTSGEMDKLWNFLIGKSYYIFSENKPPKEVEEAVEIVKLILRNPNYHFLPFKIRALQTIIDYVERER